MSRNGLCMLAIIHPVTLPSLNYYQEKTVSNFLHGKILDVHRLFIKLHKMTVKAFWIKKEKREICR